MSIPESPEDGQYFFEMDECARMTCDKDAVALLTFSPPEAKAWLYDLDKPDPTGGIMLCRKHANATVVPMSWQLIDGRDPAWPGQLGSQPPTQAMVASTAEELLATAGAVGASPVSSDSVRSSTADLPSDTDAIEEEFAALRSNLPVTPRHYGEPELATARSAGRTVDSDLTVERATGDGPDPSLFELPLSDIPAVTPYVG